MNRLKPAIPHILSIAGGALLVILFFSPLFFEGKVLDQNDVLQGISAGSEVKEYRQETGEEALWTNSMFSGMPAYLINISYSGELIKYAHRIFTLGMPSSAEVVFLSFVCFYILLVSFKVRPLFAFAGAIAYSFNTFSLVSIEAGHIWKVRAMAFMPLVVAGVHLVFTDSRKWLAVGILSLAVSLELYANHLQITYYLFLMLIVYGIVQLVYTIKEKTWGQFGKHVALLAIAAIIGVGANAARIWTAMEYSKYSTRGKTELTAETTGTPQKSGLDRDYVFDWSYGVKESLTLLVPNFSGGASVMPLDADSNLAFALRSRGAGPAQIQEQIANVYTYWGNQPSTAGPSYAGAIMLFLVVLSFFFVDKKIRNWLVFAALFGLILSWGKNFEAFNYFMFDYFPAYSKFRSVSMAMVILLLSVPLLGIVTLESFIQSEDPDKMKKLLISAGIVGGLCLILILFAGAFNYRGALDARLTQMPDWYLAAIRLDRKAMLVGDAWRSLLLIALAAGVLYALHIKKISPLVAGIVLVGLIAFDFLPVGKRFFHEEKYVRSTGTHEIKITPADERIYELAGNTNYRVLNLQNPFNEAFTSAFHSSIGGYHGAKMMRYRELIDYELTPELGELVNALRSGSQDLSGFPAINMLNAQYIKYGPAKENVITNPAAYGNAWFASKVIPVNNADEELAQLSSIDQKGTVVVNTSKFPSVGSSYDASGTIQMTDYQPNKITYQVTGQLQNGLGIFSEVYYPVGWSATIDGKPADILQVNYVLRALEVPAGSKEIVFEFSPASYRIGNLLSLIFSVVMFGMIGFGAFKAIKSS